MNETVSPCAVDPFLEALPESDRSALQPLAEMLGLRYAFVTREAGASGGREVSFLSPRHLVPVRQLPGGRWDIRIVPLALVLSMALREEPAGLELQLDLYESSPLVLPWSDATLATIVEDKAFQLLMSTCGFASSVPDRSGRPGFRGLG
jgi:hypothetical protein